MVDGAEGHVISAHPLGFHQFFDLMVGPAQHLVRRQHLPGLFHGQVGLADNITIGDRVIAGGGTIVLSNVPEGRTMLGYPATQMSKQTEIYKAPRRLPKLLRDVAALQKLVSKADKAD